MPPSNIVYQRGGDRVNMPHSYYSHVKPVRPSHLSPTNLQKHHDPGRGREDAADDGHGNVPVVREKVTELEPRHAHCVAAHRQQDDSPPQVVRAGWRTERERD